MTTDTVPLPTLVPRSGASARSEGQRPGAQAEGPPSGFFDRPEGRIAYEEAGPSEGPLVLLVPGLGDLRAEYRFLASRLNAAGYRTVAMDLRGHGESSIQWSDYSAPALGADIVALLRHLGAGPAYLVGTSMGAGAVAWAAAEAPELSRGLVLLGPFVRDTPPTMPFQQAVLKVLFARPWGPAAWGRYYTSLYPGARPEDLDDYVTRLKANLREPGRLEAAKAMIFASKAKVEERLGEVRTPVLVVMGSKDPDFGKQGAEAEARWVAERLHGTVRMIDGAGHYPHAEMPGPAGDAILQFLGELERTQEASP